MYWVIEIRRKNYIEWHCTICCLLVLKVVFVCGCFKSYLHFLDSHCNIFLLGPPHQSPVNFRNWVLGNLRREESYTSSYAYPLCTDKKENFPQNSIYYYKYPNILKITLYRIWHNKDVNKIITTLLKSDIFCLGLVKRFYLSLTQDSLSCFITCALLWHYIIFFNKSKKQQQKKHWRLDCIGIWIGWVLTCLSAFWLAENCC